MTRLNRAIHISTSVTGKCFACHSSCFMDLSAEAESGNLTPLLAPTIICNFAVAFAYCDVRCSRTRSRRFTRGRRPRSRAPFTEPRAPAWRRAGPTTDRRCLWRPWHRNTTQLRWSTSRCIRSVHIFSFDQDCLCDAQGVTEKSGGRIGLCVLITNYLKNNIGSPVILATVTSY